MDRKQRARDLKTCVEEYEGWLARHVPIVRRDLDRKHSAMADSSFAFLRATYFRWCDRVRVVVPELAKAPTALAVGDLHVENFGTWRDAESRLVWGINDFDEAAVMPYAHDLVRLSTSAILAIETGRLNIRRREAIESIFDGYRAGLEQEGQAFVLEEGHTWLRTAALGELRDPVRFWDKLSGLPNLTLRDAVVRRALDRAMPERGLQLRIAHRVAGLGSLGRARYVALARYDGGLVAREAKALAPSAWSRRSARRASLEYGALLARAVRSSDPHVRVEGTWLVRRLAPHCARIELSELPRNADLQRLFYAMGFETANVHLGTPKARLALLRDLDQRGVGFLRSAARDMADDVVADHDAYVAANLANRLS